MMTLKHAFRFVVPALTLGALLSAGAAHAQTLNFTSTLTLTNPTNNGVTLTINNGAGNNVNAAGFGTSARAGGFRVGAAPAGPTYTPYTSTFTDVLSITDIASGITSPLTLTGTLSTSVNDSQVLPHSTMIVLNPAAYEIDFPTNRFFVTLNNYDDVAPEGATGFGSVSINFQTTPVAITPEPGSVAMLVGMGISGAGLLVRRRRAARNAA